MNKRSLTFALASICILTSSLAAAEPTLPKLPLPAPTFRTPALLRCIDPAATSVDFAMVSRTSQFAGRVRITGKVKNVGNSAYESGPRQQTAQLYEIVPGARPRLVATTAFQNLAPNTEVAVSFVRDWNASSPAEGEFPPSYRVVVSYDPDILLDGNTKNDDCRTNNNTLERSGSALNALFH